MAEQIPVNFSLFGQPIAVYRARRFNYIGGPILALIGLSAVILTYQFAKNLILIGLLGIFLLLFGLIITPFGLLHLTLRVTIFPQGLQYKRGRTIIRCRWEEIVAVWQRVTYHHIHVGFFLYGGKSYTYLVLLQDGTRLVLDEKLERVKELGAAIEEEVTKHLLPQVRAAYQQGLSVHFGSIQISQQGIEIGKELLPWHEIAAIRTPHEIITIHRHGSEQPWKTLMAADIPNRSVFFALLAGMQGIMPTA